MPKHIFNLKRQTPDERDLAFFAPPSLKAEKLPPAFDMRCLVVAAYDQGDEGCCTGNQAATSIRIRLMKENLEEFYPSRNFLYYNARDIKDEDTGCSIRDITKSAARGYCSEKTWPYEYDNFLIQPHEAAYEESKQHRVSQYRKVLKTLKEVKKALVLGYPISFGFDVYESLEGDEIAEMGLMPRLKPDEESLGGHAVLAVGYDDNKVLPGFDSPGAVLVLNSWGPDWGDEGFFWFPYEYFFSDMVHDLWIIQKAN